MSEGGLGSHATIPSPGARARGEVVRLRRSVSHVVGLVVRCQSRWVLLGLVGARRRPVWVRILVVHQNGRLGGSRRAILVETGVLSGFRQNPDLVRQDPLWPDGSPDCPLSVYYPSGPLRQPQGPPGARLGPDRAWRPAGGTVGSRFIGASWFGAPMRPSLLSIAHCHMIPCAKLQTLTLN